MTYIPSPPHPNARNRKVSRCCSLGLASPHTKSGSQSVTLRPFTTPVFKIQISPKKPNLAVAARKSVTPMSASPQSPKSISPSGCNTSVLISKSRQTHHSAIPSQQLANHHRVCVKTYGTATFKPPRCHSILEDQPPPPHLINNAFSPMPVASRQPLGPPSSFAMGVYTIIQSSVNHNSFTRFISNEYGRFTKTGNDATCLLRLPPAWSCHSVGRRYSFNCPAPLST